MIRRPAGEQFWLIAQDDHARFAGALAAKLGGPAFVPPQPREHVIAAVANHDAGWPLHDDRPTLNERRLPLHVFEIRVSLATRIWSASTERAVSIHPYTGLLVSLHQIALSDFASRQDNAPHERATSSAERFELNKFQHKQIEIQESLRRELNLRTDLPLHLGLAQDHVDPAEDHLKFNFRLLTLCDRLSLQLCCGKLLFPEIDDVRPVGGMPPTKIRTRFLDNRSVALTPWPFVNSEIEVEVPYRAVSAEPFKTETAFRAAFDLAPVSKAVFSLRPM